MKGCIYFFKHTGLDPIKIGYTTKESPILRFHQFGTYAPYGSEIVGFAQVKNAKKTEAMLHNKYSNKRLSGEWFDITKHEVEKELKVLRSKEETERRNNFEIAFAKSIGITDNDFHLEVENAIFTILEFPHDGVGVWMTATEIQYMLLDRNIIEVFSMKILGGKLKAIFGEPKYKDRSSKYFVRVKE